jgi:hypothetical protein
LAGIKVETDIIASFRASPKGQAVIGVGPLILKESLGEIKEKIYNDD